MTCGVVRYLVIFAFTIHGVKKELSRVVCLCQNWVLMVCIRGPYAVQSAPQISYLNCKKLPPTFPGPYITSLTPTHPAGSHMPSPHHIMADYAPWSALLGSSY